MREALDWLRDHLALTFEREGGRVLREPWAARDAYISVVLDRSDANVSRFMAEHLKAEDTPENRVKALRLLEMQRHAMLMYTSCGWFFSDISGIEAVQNLQYAARAAELAHLAAGVDLERGLAARLKSAPSNYAEHRNGEGVYRKLALAGRMDEDRAAAHHAIASLFCEEQEHWPMGSSSAEFSGMARHHADGVRLAAGQVSVRDGVTGARWQRDLPGRGHARLHGHGLGRRRRPGARRAGGLGASGSGPCATAKGLDLQAVAGPLAKGRRFGFEDLLADERERILKCLVEKRRQVWEDSPLLGMDECLGLAEQHTRLGLELPPGLRGQTEAALDAWLLRRAREFRQKPDADLSDLSRHHGAGPLRGPQRAFGRGRGGVGGLRGVGPRFSGEGVLRGLAGPAGGSGRAWRRPPTSRAGATGRRTGFFDLLKRLPPDSDEKIRLVGEIDEAARLLEISADA